MRELKKWAVCWDKAEEVARWPSFLHSGALMSPEKKQRRKWGWQHRLRAGRALWTQSGWEAAKLQGRDYSLRAAEPQVQAQPPTFTRVSKHLQMSHSAVRDTGTGTEEMQQWGTSTSQHPAITISTQHPWEQQSLASYLTKSAKIIIFERKKSD